MAGIKLFVCFHQPTEVPKHPLLVPIQVGAALADSHFPGFLHDDAGDNISAKNRSYCELTAQYWAWKNVEADYYGFFHYRRYLYPDIKAKLPYRVEREASRSLLDKLGYTEFEQLIGQYDIIAPKGENMYLPVRDHYADAPFHHYKDLELAERIVRESHSKMIPALDTYLSNTICYFGNIYIMCRDIFHSYCAWLFSILEEYDRIADISGYSSQEQRVDGYLAERLLGVYVTFRRSELKILELPRVHFYNKSEYIRRRFFNTVLPPGTRKRAYLKRIFKAYNRICR